MSAAAVTTSPPKLKKRFAHHQTRWEKEKAAQGAAAERSDQCPHAIGPWILGDTVGKGASGRVVLAKHSRTGKLAAVKILNLHPAISSRSLSTMGDQAEKLMLTAEREIAMMKLMDHPNIMKMYDVWGNETELYLVLEYVEGGELFDYLCAHRGRLPLLEVVSIFKQVIAGVNYCHRFNICHRDLKPENILLDSITRPNKVVKIADFGMSRLDHLNGLLETSCGSPHYASPEIIRGDNYEGSSADIWSCGVILFALLTSRLPFDDPNVRKVLHKVKQGVYTIPDEVPPVARDLVARILTPVERRISMEGILAHPLLKMATPGIIVNPAPSLSELALPVIETEIDPDLLRNLGVILRIQSVDTLKRDLVRRLTSSEKNWEKAFYFLLTRYRDKLFEEFNMDGLPVAPERRGTPHHSRQNSRSPNQPRHYSHSPSLEREQEDTRMMPPPPSPIMRFYPGTPKLGSLEAKVASVPIGETLSAPTPGTSPIATIPNSPKPALAQSYTPPSSIRPPGTTTVTRKPPPKHVRANSQPQPQRSYHTDDRSASAAVTRLMRQNLINRVVPPSPKSAVPSGYTSRAFNSAIPLPPVSAATTKPTSIGPSVLQPAINPIELRPGRRGSANGKRPGSISGAHTTRPGSATGVRPTGLIGPRAGSPARSAPSSQATRPTSAGSRFGAGSRPPSARGKAHSRTESSSSRPVPGSPARSLISATRPTDIATAVVVPRIAFHRPAQSSIDERSAQPASSGHQPSSDAPSSMVKREASPTQDVERIPGSRVGVGLEPAPPPSSPLSSVSTSSLSTDCCSTITGSSSTLHPLPTLTTPTHLFSNPQTLQFAEALVAEVNRLTVLQNEQEAKIFRAQEQRHKEQEVATRARHDDEDEKLFRYSLSNLDSAVLDLHLRLPAPAYRRQHVNDAVGQSEDDISGKDMLRVRSHSPSSRSPEEAPVSVILVRRKTDEGPAARADGGPETPTRLTPSVTAQQRDNSGMIMMPGGYSSPQPIFIASTSPARDVLAIAAGVRDAPAGVSPQSKSAKKSRPTTIDVLAANSVKGDMRSHSPLMSPFLGFGHAAGGRGFFARLFDWKTPSYHLFSVEDCYETRKECMTLLQALGATVVVEDADHSWGILKCRVDEIEDSDRTLASKYVRFRVEFAHYSGPLTPPGTATPRLGGTMSMNKSLSGSGPVPGSGPLPAPPPGILVTSTLSLIQERGALSSFKATYNRLRDMWTFDKFHSPALPLRPGSPSPVLEHTPAIQIPQVSRRN